MITVISQEILCYQATVYKYLLPLRILIKGVKSVHVPLAPTYGDTSCGLRECLVATEEIFFHNLCCKVFEDTFLKDMVVKADVYVICPNLVKLFVLENC